jgi:plasmid stabilization system protein ParE
VTEVTYTAAARADLIRIIDDLAQRAGLAVAERYERRFNDALDLFERHPAIGAPRPSLGATTRLWAVPPYVFL